GGAEIEARFHSECKQVVRDGYTLLDGDDGDMALIPVVDSAYTFRPARHAYIALQKTARHQWLPYNGTVLTAQSDRTVIGHVIVPVKDTREAERIVKSVKSSTVLSGDYSLSFVKSGKRYQYEFVSSSEGLTLR
ncbi:hypothetical protein ACFL47_10420, partial [Candidatus Latescibacterota bacterium]